MGEKGLLGKKKSQKDPWEKKKIPKKTHSEWELQGKIWTSFIHLGQALFTKKEKKNKAGRKTFT